MQKIDFGKLLGFETVAGCDFQDETFGAKLGAKVGDAEPAPPSKTPLTLEVQIKIWQT